MDPVLTLCRALADAGGRPYLVGGCVRDRLLGRGPKDLDIEVYGLAADVVRAVCARVGTVDEVGASFAILRVTVGGETVDVSLPRRESRTGRGHRDFAVAADPGLSPAEAARRRDFTVNAILQDPVTGEIVDPFGGVRDLQARVLRAVDSRTFGDDPLRALRAVRFASTLGFRVEAHTLGLCRSVDFDALPGERIGEELMRLLAGNDPGAGLRTLAAMWRPGWLP